MFVFNTGEWGCRQLSIDTDIYIHYKSLNSANRDVISTSVS